MIIRTRNEAVAAAEQQAVYRTGEWREKEKKADKSLVCVTQRRSSVLLWNRKYGKMYTTHILQKEMKSL